MILPILTLEVLSRNSRRGWLWMHQEPQFKSLLSFFEHGFALTNNDRQSKFNLSLSPWIRSLCDWWEDPDVEWIYLIQGSQTSKTTFMMGAMLYVAQFVQGATPMLWIQSTEEEANIFVSERLRPFIESADDKAIKNWKKEYFRVFHSSVKVGYGTSIQSLRCFPVRYIFGDECGIWRIPISYTKKRTRTFEGQRKGIFCTTPPFDGSHFSWKDATASNFHQYEVPCPRCEKYQVLRFSGLQFADARINGEWDQKKIQETIRYKCVQCGGLIENSEKMEMLKEGRLVCVDPKTYEPRPLQGTTARTLQISGLYSPFTHWGTIATSFLEAKAGGFESLKVFFTDELAEIPQEQGEKISEFGLRRLIDSNRKPGFMGGYDLYTLGIDVQRLGELYCVLLGWKRGMSPSGHVLTYFQRSWLGIGGQPDWIELLEAIKDYREKLYCVAVDATDGVVAQQIKNFCATQGHPFVPLVDSTTTQHKIEFKRSDNFKAAGSALLKRNRIVANIVHMLVNSDMIKDDLSIGLSRTLDDPEAWSFHSETNEVFLKHLENEYRVTEKSHGRTRATWRPKYHGAPQHYLSALVYAVAAMESYRFQLQKMDEMPARLTRNRIISAGVDPYSMDY